MAAVANLSSYISPHCAMTTGIFGLLFGFVGTFSIFRNTSIPSMARPVENERFVFNSSTYVMTSRTARHEMNGAHNFFYKQREPTEHYVFAVQKTGLFTCNKELAAISVFTTVGLKITRNPDNIAYMTKQDSTNAFKYKVN